MRAFLSPIASRILRQTIADGGELELSGLDKHPWISGRVHSAVSRLVASRYGTRELAVSSPGVVVFRINAAGRMAYTRAMNAAAVPLEDKGGAICRPVRRA